MKANDLPFDSVPAAAKPKSGGFSTRAIHWGYDPADHQGALVPPQRVAGLLEDMIGRRSGLRLLSLRTLPVTPVLER